MKVFLKSLLFASGWIAMGWVCCQVYKQRTGPRHDSHTTAAPWAAVFDQWAAKPELQSASVGLVLLDSDDHIIYSSALGETALCPASALKTLTTGAAFGILGPEFRFETQLIDRQDGNLVLVGGGDPTLTLKDIEDLATAAVQSGLKEVSGDLISDSTVFSAAPVNDHWNWGDIGNAYGAGAFGLNVEHNKMSVRFLPEQKVGEPAEFLDGSPAPTGTSWATDVTTGPAGSRDGVSIYSSPGSRAISMHGTVPQGPIFTVNGAITDPPAVALETLRAALEKSGVTFSKKFIPQKGKTIVLATHRSAPLPEIIDHLHKVSDNLEAQCLFFTLGNHLGKDPAIALREYWEKAGVHFQGLRQLDGNGLARANMIRPLDLARVNLAARRGPYGGRYFQSLNPSLNGEVRAKLGSMSGVKTDVGFLRLENGKELTFALMANGLNPTLNFWPLRNELLKALSIAAN
jgi:D-alanyl-D-alanine carboxypeptidase/D-alanyl-D-alanine-endopeptidase (penicillin-binding protein 4)